MSKRLLLWTGALLLLALAATSAVFAWRMASETARGFAADKGEGDPREPTIVAVAPTAVPTADPPGWPNLFGPQHNSVSSEGGLSVAWTSAGPPRVWSREIGTGYSAPVALGERLIVLHRLGDEEVVECFDPETGDSRWQHRYPTSYQCKYRYSNGPYSTPIIDDEFVFAVGAEGALRCLNAADGQLVWRRDLSDEYQLEEGLFGVGSTPLLEGDRLIFNVGAYKDDAGVIALDRRTGATLWTATDHRAGYATPIAATIHGRRYVFVVTYEGLVALDPRDGRVFWSIDQRPMSPDSLNATSPAVWGDLVLMVTGPGPGALCLRVSPDGGYEEVWRDRRVLDSQFNPLVCTDGYLFGYTSSRQGGAVFRCVQAATGRMCWEWESVLDRGTVLAADGKLILLGEQGHLAALAATPREARPLSPIVEPLLSGPCYSAPALHRGRLILRNEGTLLSLDLRDTASLDSP
ncbi:MAG: PQQ-like beta-propeller repeat protein [Pirellulaceae bacterium]